MCTEAKRSHWLFLGLILGPLVDTDNPSNGWCHPFEAWYQQEDRISLRPSSSLERFESISEAQILWSGSARLALPPIAFFKPLKAL